MANATTGERIRERRKQLNITADVLAERIGVSRATIYRYEKGDIERAPANLLPRLAEELRTNLAYLLGLDDNPMAETADYYSNAKKSLAKQKLLDISHDMNDDEIRQLLLVAQLIVSQRNQD